MIWSIVLSKKTSLCAVGSNRCLEREVGEDPLPAICWLMLLAGEQQHPQPVLGEIWIWSLPQPWSSVCKQPRDPQQGVTGGNSWMLAVQRPDLLLTLPGD